MMKELMRYDVKERVKEVGVKSFYNICLLRLSNLESPLMFVMIRYFNQNLIYISDHSIENLSDFLITNGFLESIKSN